MATMTERKLGARLRDAQSAQRRLNALEAQTARVAETRDIAVYAAQEAGATRADLEAATGLSTARITQVLRREKARRTTGN